MADRPINKDTVTILLANVGVSERPNPLLIALAESWLQQAETITALEAELVEKDQAIADWEQKEADTRDELNELRDFVDSGPHSLYSIQTGVY